MAGKNKSNADLEAMVAQLHEVMETGDHEKGLALAEEVLEGHPKQREAWLMKAVCLDGLGDDEGALAEFEALTEEFPDDAEVWVLAGDFCYFSGDLDAAEDALRTALELAEDKDHPDEEMAFEAHTKMAALLMDTGDLEEALEHAHAARVMDRDNADAEVVVGEVQFEMGRFEDAAKSASRAIDRDARHAGAYVLRGMVQEREGGVAAAKKAYEKAHALDPDAFPPSMEMTDEALLDAVAEALSDMPTEFQEFMKDVKLTVRGLPTDEEVKEGHVSPSAPLAFKGDALDDEAAADKPSELLLFKPNIVRHHHDREAVLDTLVASMGMEIEGFLALDEDLPADDAFPN